MSLNAKVLIEALKSNRSITDALMEDSARTHTECFVNGLESMSRRIKIVRLAELTIRDLSPEDYVRQTQQYEHTPVYETFAEQTAYTWGQIAAADLPIKNIGIIGLKHTQ